MHLGRPTVALDSVWQTSAAVFRHTSLDLVVYFQFLPTPVFPNSDTEATRQPALGVLRLGGRMGKKM